MSDYRLIGLPDRHQEVIGGLKDLALSMCPPEPPEGWRTVAPADCVGIPAISMGYMNELTELAREKGLHVNDGDTVEADYECRDGEWWPIPDSVRVTR